MKQFSAHNPFPTTPSAAGTRWMDAGVIGVGLGSTALVWREDR
jgi:hypothetical protein